VITPIGAVFGAASDRWLVAFTLALFVVLVGGWVARRRAQRVARAKEGSARVRGTRRRAGALLAVGPVAGLLAAPGAGSHVAVAALGAAALAGFGLVVERRRGVDRQVALAAFLAAVVAVVAGVRFAPTGVGVLDVVLGVAIVFGLTMAFDGLGNADSLVAGLAGVSALGLLALGGFAEQFGVANGAAGILGACVAFLAYNLPPASLFAGRAGRLATGFALGVLALSVHTVPGPPGPLVVPLMLLAVPLLDAGVVLFDRLQRRRPVLVQRRDHLVHRFVAQGATKLEGVLVLVLTQSALVVLAVFAGRDLVPVWVAGAFAALIVGTLGGYALRAPLDRAAPIGLTAGARWVIGAVVLVLVLGTVPLVLDVPDVTDTMDRGRVAAQQGLAAARAGDAITAQMEFRQAAAEFGDARDQLGSAKYQAARLVPGVAPNLRAARALAEIGYDLASNGVGVTSAVDPDALTVVDGTIPIDEVRRVTPALVQGADTLERSLARLDDVAEEPYLLSPVRDAVSTVHKELARGAREARNTAAAVELAPAIFGADGAERRYLLVVQNPAENRGTGGLIGSYGILTASDGNVDVGRLLRTGVWNANTEANGDPDYTAPTDYVKRYGQFRPQFNLQNVNLSPDFPTVGTVLETLAPEAGMGTVDGVLAVDPQGLAALLQLTGPVDVPGWPEPITAENVVDVTLSEAYAAFANTPERADFLGDVAQAVVDEATSGELGSPARVAQVLGKAAHQGHLVLSFTRPGEQRLAGELRADGAMATAGDTLHVTDANFGGNKLDYYLVRNLDYRLEVRPDASGRGAAATGALDVHFENTAPDDGLPRIVAGPYEGAPAGRFQEGENVSYVSVYTPLGLEGSTLDGQAVPMSAGEELGVQVYSTIVRLLAGQARTLQMDLAGRIEMDRGGWYELALGSQPMVNDGRARISISVPDGWRITDARGLQSVQSSRASGFVVLDHPTTIRVRIERATDSFWDRLDGPS